MLAAAVLACCAPACYPMHAIAHIYFQPVLALGLSLDVLAQQVSALVRICA